MLSKKTRLSFIFLLTVWAGLNTVNAVPFDKTADYAACFTPGQSCATLIVHAINSSQHHIQVQAYSFTSKDIANALIAAAKRGVKVEVVIDQSELVNQSRVWWLLKAGIPVWLDNQVALAHNKVMIFDDRAVLTGSYNFTQAAERNNAENILIIYDKGLADLYHQNWQHRQSKSVLLTLSSAKEWQKKLRDSGQRAKRGFNQD